MNLEPVIYEKLVYTTGMTVRRVVPMASEVGGFQWQFFKFNQFPLVITVRQKIRRMA